MRNREAIAAAIATPGFASRFWSNVNVRSDDECWPWKSKIKPRADGRPTYATTSCRIDGQTYTVRAHRVAFALTCGPIGEGVDVLHSCDNPVCCNPRHLRGGSDLDNSRDKYSRGRGVLGQRHGLCKLTADQVLEIRRRRACGEKITHLAKEFGVSRETTSHIIHRRHWVHLP